MGEHKTKQHLLQGSSSRHTSFFDLARWIPPPLPQPPCQAEQTWDISSPTTTTRAWPRHTVTQRGCFPFLVTNKPNTLNTTITYGYGTRRLRKGTNNRRGRAQGSRYAHLFFKTYFTHIFPFPFIPNTMKMTTTLDTCAVGVLF